MPQISRGRRVVGSLLLLGIIIVIAVIDWRWKASPDNPGQAVGVWLANMAMLLAFTIIVGDFVTGFLRGVLIDSSNKISLSRLQMLLWTVLILSGFLTAVIINIHRGQSEPVSIAVPTELWALLGISTASLVGSPLIKNNKQGEKTNNEAAARTESLMINQGVDTSTVEAKGQIVANKDPKDASWIDIFKGEEVGNAAFLDLGKIQMFFFTVVTWVAYAITLGNELQNSVKPGAAKFSAFPALDTGIVALLGISHAGYLTNKAIPHTPQQQPTSTQPPPAPLSPALPPPAPDTPQPPAPPT